MRAPLRVAITRRVRDELAGHTALLPQKIAVVPYGIDAARFSPDAIGRREAREQFGITGERFVIGIVGGYDPGKGQREFIEALALAAGEEPELAGAIHGLMVGERPSDTGEYTAELRRRRDALPFADRIRFHPFIDDPRPAYRAMDIFVLASHSETFGMVLQEAMAMGVPAIGTDSGGVPEIITDERTGLLVPPKDPRAIADAILRLYRDPELRARLALAAREFVQQAYDPNRQYEAFERALLDALERRRTV